MNYYLQVIDMIDGKPFDMIYEISEDLTKCRILKYHWGWKTCQWMPSNMDYNGFQKGAWKNNKDVIYNILTEDDIFVEKL